MAIADGFFKDLSTCDICGKKKNQYINHEKCSKIRQQRYQEKNVADENRVNKKRWAR